MQLQESGGEGGIRTPGTGFSQYNGLAREAVPGPVARNQRLTADGSPIFGRQSPCSGTTVPQLFPYFFRLLQICQRFVTSYLVEDNYVGTSVRRRPYKYIRNIYKDTGPHDGAISAIDYCVGASRRSASTLRLSLPCVRSPKIRDPLGLPLLKSSLLPDSDLCISLLPKYTFML